jgi:hypothetical protein
MMHEQNIVCILYRKLITLYPREFREQLGESMQQTFNDLYRENQTGKKQHGFVLWMFVETAVGIFREHALLVTEGDIMKNLFTNPGSTALVSSILLAIASIVAPFIYLVGNLRDALGALSYDIADFLYGPVWAASLISIVFVLRERIGDRSPRRMSLALLAAVLAAGITVAVAFIRSANRHYHILHPELHLENSSDILVMWATLVAGLTNTAWHFLGWALVLIGSAGWTSRALPRLLSALYVAAGINSLFVYLIPNSEGTAVMLSVIVMVWQGFLLWKTGLQEKQSPGINSSELDQA